MQVLIWSAAFAVLSVLLVVASALDENPTRRQFGLVVYGVNAICATVVASIMGLAVLANGHFDFPRYSLPYLWGATCAIACFSLTVHMPLALAFGVFHRRWDDALTQIQGLTYEILSRTDGPKVAAALEDIVAQNRAFLRTWHLEAALSEIGRALTSAGMAPVDLAKNVHDLARYVQVVQRSGSVQTPHENVWSLISGAGLAVVISLAIQLA